MIHINLHGASMKRVTAFKYSWKEIKTIVDHKRDSIFLTHLDQNTKSEEGEVWWAGEPRKVFCDVRGGEFSIHYLCIYKREKKITD